MSDRILELHGLIFGEGEALDAVIEAGSLLLVHGVAHRFFDILQGIERPSAGNVLYAGADWYDMPPFQECRLRGEFGRCFRQDTAWVRNLTLRENIELSSHYHANSQTRGDTWLQDNAAHLGLADYLDLRPEYAERSILKRAQWLRIFLTQRKIILLQDPDTGVKQAHCSLLRGWINEHIRSGGAAVWAFEGILPEVADLGATSVMNFDLIDSQLKKIGESRE